MNPLLRLVLLLAAAIGIGGWLLHDYLHQKTSFEARLDLARIERTFDERAPAAREIAAGEDYGDEMRGLFKWYFGAVRDHDNHYPEFKDHEQHWKDIERRHATGKIKGPEFDAYKANHDTVEDVYKVLSSTGYEPVLSASNDGQHFDFWRIERQSQDGKPKIRLDFAWWGPQRRDETEEHSDTSTTVHHLVVNASITAFDIALEGDPPDAEAKRKAKRAGQEAAPFHAEMHGGEPDLKITDPDHYVELFPANVVLGTYWLDLLPHEATHMHIDLATVTRTVQGHELPGKFSWDVPLKDDWKLAEGEAWAGATVETRDPDDAAGAEADASDEKPARHGRHHR